MSKELENKIIIFEDDISITTMLENYLSELGATVVSFPDGSNAIERINAHEPDMVVMDVVMPVNDGFTIIQELRKTSSVPVILLTDKNSVDDKVFGLESGADDYLCKPFSPKELKARIKALLRRNAGNGASTREIISFNELVIDHEIREVSSNDAPIKLTKMEFDLLHFMVKKFPSVVTREELYMKILGYKPEIETKALVMHVMNLRRKLIRASVTSFEVKAVPGIGYKISQHQK